MIGTKELDELERQANRSIARGSARGFSPQTTLLLVALAREAIALRAAAKAHNAGQIAECEGRQQSDGYAGLCAAHMRTSRGRCPDCPRLDMIEVG